MEIKCALCGNAVENPWYFSAVYKFRQKWNRIEAERYDEAWICADCFNRIERELGALYDKMQNEESQQEDKR